jgi:hypothetical protein
MGARELASFANGPKRGSEEGKRLPMALFAARPTRRPGASASLDLDSYIKTTGMEL